MKNRDSGLIPNIKEMAVSQDCSSMISWGNFPFIGARIRFECHPCLLGIRLSLRLAIWQHIYPRVDCTSDTST